MPVWVGTAPPRTGPAVVVQAGGHISILPSCPGAHFSNWPHVPSAQLLSRCSHVPSGPGGRALKLIFAFRIFFENEEKNAHSNIVDILNVFLPTHSITTGYSSRSLNDREWK